MAYTIDGRSTPYARKKNAVRRAHQQAAATGKPCHVYDSRGVAVIVVKPEHIRNGSDEDYRIHATGDTRITRDDYPAFFTDFDGDGIPAVDDPEPYDTRNTRRIEETKLSDEMGKLIDYRDSMQGLFEDVGRDVQKLAGARGGKFLGRVKTPYSMINKLRRKRLVGDQGLTDVVATTIVMPDRYGVETIRKALEDGALGRAMLDDDFYTRPNQGYRAYHFTLWRQMPTEDGRTVEVPVELQLKSARIAALGKGTHTAYKADNADVKEVDRLFKMADLADQGDKAAMRIIDPILKRGPAHIAKLVAKTSKRHKNPSKVQVLVFPRPQYTPTSAREWADSHGYVSSNANMMIRDGVIHIHQTKSARMSGLRSVSLGGGVRALR
jgi:ppGpp synthetase/RelA/SpoT-type nucleotidyltranferase